MQTAPAAQPLSRVLAARVAAGQKPALVANVAVGRVGVPLGPHALELTVHGESAAPNTFAVLVSGTGHGPGPPEEIVPTFFPLVPA